MAVIKDVSFVEWLKTENAKDPDNMLPVELDFELAIYFLKNYLLGEDWYVAYPGSAKQITTDIVYCILEKYSRKFRKELKALRKAKDRLPENVKKIELSLALNDNDPVKETE